MLQGDLKESIKEQFVSWDKPLTASISTSFYVESGKPVFGFAPGILDDYNLYLRFFFQSGKRYTPAVFTGSVDATGKSRI